MTKTDRHPGRIVIINDASLARGGATGLALLEAKLLRDLGLPVTYICGDQGDPSLREHDIEIVALGEQPLVAQTKLGAATGGLFRKATVEMIDRWIKENDTPATIYHVHGWSKILSPSVFVPLRKVASRTFIHAHDFFLACPNGAYMDYQRMEGCSRKPLSLSCMTTHCDKRSRAQKMWRASRSLVLKRVFTRFHDWGGILCLHEEMCEGLSRGGVPENLIQTVRNPAVPFCDAPVDAGKNEQFLFVGRVETEKGIVELTQAATELGLPLTVAGDGPLREELAEKYPNVTFAGWSDRDAIARYAKTARALVMPSLYPEPFGLVIVEAALSGIPVIVADGALLSQEIVELGIGLATPTDKASLKKALKQMHDLPVFEVSAMSKRAAAASNLCHTPESWIKTLQTNFAQSLQKSPNS